MDIKKLIKLQNAIIKAHQKIKTVQSDNNLQTKEIKNEFKKEFNVLNKALELLSKELNSFTKKEDSNKQNEELERLKESLNEVNKNIDDKISKIQLKHGKDGINGIDGKNGINGKDGINGIDGKNGKDGSNGLSAYEIAVKQGYKGTEKEWIDHITNNGGHNYSGQIAAMNQKLNAMAVIEKDGEGNKFLADDGTYKEVSGSDDIPTKTSELENDSEFITNDIETDFNIDGKLYLNTVKSGVSDAAASRIVFGTPSKVYSYLSSNNAGAFAFSKGKGNITVYPNTGTYNCLMTDCNSDLGRSDSKWKDLYLSGNLKDGTNTIPISKIATTDYIDQTIGDIETLLGGI